MARRKTAHTDADLDFLKRNLTDILTRDRSGVAELTQAARESEIIDMVRALQDAASGLNNKWAGAILAKVPQSALERLEERARIRNGSAASMRFLSKDLSAAESLVAEKAQEARKALMEALVKGMQPLQRLVYGEMLRWLRADKHPDLNVTVFPYSSDTAFGYRLLFLQNAYNDRICCLERLYRAKHGVPDSETTPFHATEAFADESLSHFCRVLMSWWDDVKESEAMTDSILVRVSTNLSVNRALLEVAASDEQGFEAAEMTVSFLNQLNSNGRLEVPREVDQWTPENEQQKLRELLYRWFGQGGCKLGKNTVSGRPMYLSHVDAVIEWSLDLRERYIAGRGSLGGPEHARQIHGRPYSLFLFAVAITGCFYESTKTEFELKGNKNRKYAVFPFTDASPRAPVHAAEVLMQAYGLIYFANSGHEMRSDRVLAYARVSRIKRDDIEQLLLFAVKQRSARELLVLFNRLDPTRPNGFEDLLAIPPSSSPENFPPAMHMNTRGIGHEANGTSILLTYSMLSSMR